MDPPTISTAWYGPPAGFAPGQRPVAVGSFGCIRSAADPDGRDARSRRSEAACSHLTLAVAQARVAAHLDASGGPAVWQQAHGRPGSASSLSRKDSSRLTFYRL